MDRDDIEPSAFGSFEHAMKHVTTVLAASANALYGAELDASDIALDLPRRSEFGDRATNVAFSLAKVARRSPQQIAAELVADATSREPRLSEQFSDIRADGGFINLRLAPAVWQNALAAIVAQGREFGVFPRNGQRISLEFGSANPTGPLVVVQGRALSIGDALAKAMRFCGYDVFTEWIVNDAGAQMERLARSIYARYRQINDPAFPFPEDGYPGEYLLPIARALYERDGRRFESAPEAEWLPYVQAYGRDAIVCEQRQTAERFGVAYDLWQSEKALHDTGAIAEGIQRARD